MLDFTIAAYKENLIFMYYILTLVTIVGLVIGSFLNVVGLRFLSGESIVFPASKCPKCNTTLKWYDNIPVLAYVLLKGKCRYCHTKISLQYPIVELLTAIVFVLIFMKFTFSLATIFLWILAGACMVMCITDFKEQVIFDAISIPLIPIGLIYSFFNLGNEITETIKIFGLNFNWTFIDALIGIAISFAIFELISLVSKLTIKQRAFGEGDTIIAMVFGAYFGWKIAIITAILGFIIQAVATFPIIAFKLFQEKDKASIISFIGLIVALILPLPLNHIEWFNGAIGSLFLLFLTMGIAIVSAITFLKRMKELNSYTMLPFGPALILGGFLALFFKDYFMGFLG